MSQRRKTSSSHVQSSKAKQSKPLSTPTLALIAVIALVVVGGIWFTMQSGSNDMFARFGFGKPQQSAATQQQRITPAQYQADFVKAKKSHLLVDVRTPEEFASGHIPGAINISLQSLPQRMQELPKDQPIVLYCRSGNRSNTATQMLARAGYTDLYDLGGIVAWANQGLPIQ